MSMLTLRRLVKKLRRAVIREFIRACHEGVLDDDRVGFVIHNAIMQMSAEGFTGVWLPTLRSPWMTTSNPLAVNHHAMDRRRAAHERHQWRRPLHLRPEWRKRRPPTRTHQATVRFMGTSSVRCATPESSTPQSSPPYARPLPPPPSPRPQPRQKRRDLGGGHRRLRRPDLVGAQPWRLGRAARPFFTNAVVDSPPPYTLPIPSPTLLPPRRHAGEAVARRPGLRSVKDEAATNGDLPNGIGTGGWLSSDEEKEDSIS